MNARSIEKLAYAALCPMLISTLGVRAEDWSEWRGPSRSGALKECPALIDSIPEGGLKELWKVEVPGGGNGNWSSPVGANGKAYVHVSWAKKEPIEQRKIDGGVLKRLGRFDKSAPQAIMDKIETARVSEERKKQDGKAVKGWVKNWVETNLNEEERKKYGRMAEDRLNRGVKALSVETLKELHGLGNKTFANQAELDEWIAGAGLNDADKTELNKHVPKDRSYRDDVLVCVDAKTGKIAWQKEYSGGGGGRPASNTPCVDDGKVYFRGNSGVLYCLDAGSGDEVWKDEAAGKDAPNSSMTVVDGKLIVAGKGALVALDAKTGKEAWRCADIKAQDNSPSVWVHGGKSYIIAAGGKIGCVDAADGKVVWTVPGNKWTTPAVSGDFMAFTTSGKQMSVYKLSLEKAEEVATFTQSSRSCSPIMDGKFAYCMARGDGVCIDAETGKEVWKGKGNNDTYSSPLLADGKILCNHRRGFILYDAATGKELGQAPIGFGECMSLGIVDGKLLARSNSHLTCYDLRKASGG